MPEAKKGKTAQLYRMVMPDHLCPYGLKSKDLLERQGYAVEDHPLESREATEAFMEKHDVDTTPQAFIGGERIGGYDDLRVHFGIDKPPEERSDVTYQPVIAIFAVTALLALGLSWHQYGTIFTLRAVEWFISLSMTLSPSRSCRTSRASRPCSSTTTSWPAAGCPTASSTRSARRWPAS
jgi:glutaredoxin